MKKGVLQAASIALACAVALVVTDSLTRSRIELNVAQREYEQLAAIVGGTLPSTVPSTGPSSEPIWRRGIWELGDGRLILRRSIEGYGGPIELLIAVEQSSVRILGLRVIAHQETPGIADFLGRPDQGWLASTHGMGVVELEAADGVSGATITSRAVTRALTAALCAAVTTRPATVPTTSPATEPPTVPDTVPATDPAFAPCATVTSRDVRR